MDDLESQPAAQPIEFEELRERLVDPDLVLLDVLPAEVYRRGHLPTARSLPLDELPRRVSKVVESKLDEVIVYCRNEH